MEQRSVNPADALSATQSDTVDINGIYPVPENVRAMGTGAYIFCFWSTAIIIQVAAIGTFMLKQGLNYYQVIAVGVISGILVSFFASVTSVPGLQFGVPFIVQLRTSFGYRGARIAYIFRIVPAIIWYGIGSWIGAQAIDTVMMTLFNLPSMIFVHFFLLTIVHILLSIKGVGQITWFNALVSSIIVIALVYFFGTILMTGSLDFTPYTSRTYDWGLVFFSAVSAATANWATVMLNNSDLTRQLKPATMRNSFISNLLGIFPPWQAMVFFGLLIFVATGNDDPIGGLMALAPNKTMGIILLLFIVMAQITSNLTTSLLPAALAFRDIFKMSWKTGAIVSSLLSIATMPWVLFTADWFFVFQNVYSSFLGPMLGILLADFWIIHNRQCDIDGLYNPDSGKYTFFKGYSLSGFLTLGICAVISFINLGISWLVGWPCSFVLYWFFKKVLKLDERFSTR